MTCPACSQEEDRCLCALVQPIATKTRVLILQHPQEPDEELGSARLAHLCLPNSTLRVGLSWPNLKAASGAEALAKKWVVLYLGSARARSATDSPLIFLDRKGAPLDVPRIPLESLKGVVVLDGSWSQAKTLWWRNAWLLKLQRAVLVPRRPSLYQRLRREPRRDSLSTLEAVALSLSAIEKDPAIAESLLNVFGQFLQKYRERAIPLSVPSDPSSGP
jgi:DTW domain-containing protein